MAPESVTKSQNKSQGNPHPVGVATDPSLRGKGPAKGAPNAGRPTNEFREECARLQREVALPKAQKVLASRVFGPGHVKYEAALSFVSKFGEKETAKVREISGLDGGPILLEATIRDLSDDGDAEDES